MVVDVEVPVAEAELVTDALFALGATAVSEEVGATPNDPLVLTADLPDDADVDRLGRRVRLHVPPPVAPPPARLVLIGPVAVHHPDQVPPPGRFGVAIDPAGMFGHGDHPTTRLALAAVVRHAAPGVRVLDVGSGTGVLAVASAVLGATARAVDTDPGAVAATTANAARNGVTDRVTVDQTPAAALVGTHDLVVANLLVTEHRVLASVLPRLVAPGGHLTVSGLLPAQLDELLAALPPWPAERARDGDWAAATLRRPPIGGRVERGRTRSAA